MDKNRGKRLRGQGTGNVESKLEKRLEEGDYYGALQMYKTLYSRSLNGNEYDKSIDLAFHATCALLKFHQLNAATEMGLLMIEAYMEGKVLVSAESKDRIKEIANAYKDVLVHSNELATFLQAAIKWSSTLGSRTRGDPELHLLLAHTYVDVQDYASACKHYLHSERPNELTKTLITWSDQGYSSERDIFVARAVLQLLCLENLRDANKVFEGYLSHFKSNKCELDSPLINFIGFLLLTLERDALPLFKLLQEKYAPSLNRDEMFRQYLAQIGKKFYGIEPPKSGLNAIMSMFGGGL